MNEAAPGCPAPQPITIQQRLHSLLNKKITVFTPGFPKLTKTVGKLTRVSSDSFVVGTTQVFFDTSFYIVLPTRVTRVQPFDVSATAEDIGGLKGKLIRTGRNFVEFVQVPGRNVPTLFPLNPFSEVSCEEEHEE